MLRRSFIFIAALTALASPSIAQSPGNAEQERWKKHASAVTIIRDDWGIAHVYGKSDADTVFGAIYAQAEDDFFRIETNYLNSLGRLSEAEGESKVWQDLRMRMFLDTPELKKHYAESPVWLRTLCDAWADGLNYYLSKHPNNKPRALGRFEPWMAFSFTEGSIGGDIEGIAVKPIEDFYSTPTPRTTAALRMPATDPDAPQPGWIFPQDPSGSNGIAIAPSNTTNKRALLLINPHTTFFFRSELQMVSEEGMHAYGASTWGQFFLYQGFNDRVGWMHTSSNVDVVDEYIETVAQKDGKWFYQHGSATKPIEERPVTISFRKPDGTMGERRFTVLKTQHGPVIRRHTAADQWVTVSLMVKPVEALQESWLRTKARNYKEYLQTMQLKANSSNNTITPTRTATSPTFTGISSPFATHRSTSRSQSTERTHPRTGRDCMR